MWAREYSGNHLSSITIQSYIYKSPLKLYYLKQKPYVNLAQKWQNFFGLLGIWDELSLSGQMMQYSRSFLEEMNTVCSRPKIKMSIQSHQQQNHQNQRL